MDTDSSPQGVVAVVRDGNRFLVIRRSQSVRAPGAYCFPGGAIEAGEDEEQALRREMREELGCEVRPLTRVWQSVTAWRVSLAWWLVELPQPACLVANPHEVASVHWWTADEMRATADLLSSNREFLDAWQRGQFSLDWRAPR
jgi:8-oxo-dGTP pyrophosphatase MutT (NUDIX family)